MDWSLGFNDDCPIEGLDPTMKPLPRDHSMRSKDLDLTKIIELYLNSIFRRGLP